MNRPLFRRPSPDFHGPFGHRNLSALCHAGFLHERRDHRRRSIVRPEFAVLVEELLPPVEIVAEDFMELRFRRIVTMRLLKMFAGPNRLAYHGATLRNMRQPCSSPNTSIIRSRCRHMTRIGSSKAGSGGSSPVRR